MKKHLNDEDIGELATLFRLLAINREKQIKELMQYMHHRNENFVALQKEEQVLETKLQLLHPGCLNDNMKVFIA